jgi:tRNA threonylcarbamoyl adenosine modification protein YeaZ
MGKGQAERLVPMLEDLLRDAGHQWRDLTTIGVGTGPGNFTGVRIAVATARGLALGLSVPAIGVSTLEAQAEGLAGPVVSTIDARRDGVYMQTFAPQTPPRVADPANLGPLPFANPLCVGHRAAEIAGLVGGRAVDAPFPLAVSIARIASRRRPDARPAPLYLRPADAAPSRDVAPRILP